MYMHTHVFQTVFAMASLMHTCVLFPGLLVIDHYNIHDSSKLFSLQLCD